MLIDKGSDRGVAPGAHFAIYRAVRNYIPDLRGGVPTPRLHMMYELARLVDPATSLAYLDRKGNPAGGKSALRA